MEALRALLLDSSSSDTTTPLGVLYSRCHAVHAQQDRLVASKDFELIEAARALFSRTETAVESVGLFSSNEDKEDLATADMKYLLLPFYRGSLLSAAPVRTDGGQGVSSSRLAAVSSSLTALGSFLQRCEQYDLLGALASSAIGSDGVRSDPAQKRMFKVEKFKREKMLGAALGALEARRSAAAAQEREDEAGVSGSAGPSVTRGTAGSSADDTAHARAAAPAAAAAAGGAGGAGVLDEEDERQLWEWRLELAALQSMDLQSSLKQEVELLQHAAAREAAAAAAGPGPSSAAAAGDRRGRAASGGPGPGPGEAERAELMERLRGICRDLDGGRREQIKQNVFKPGHILPTMTVEEAGEIEAREAAEREARQRKQEEKERARRAALDSDEEDAEDKDKQRAMDDWRDWHPKGYGNSKLRPCG